MTDIEKLYDLYCKALNESTYYYLKYNKEDEEKRMVSDYDKKFYFLDLLNNILRKDK